MEAVSRGRSDDLRDGRPQGTRLAAKEEQHRPQRKIALLVGAFFILQMVAFAVGSPLIDSFFSGAAGDRALVAGVLLEVFAGLVVVGIGFAMLPVLLPHARRLALAYPLARVLEFLTIVAIGVYFLTTRNEWKDYHLLIYSFTAPGGLVLSYLLLRSKLVARWLAVLGIVGYGGLLLGTVLTALGVADLHSGAGYVFLLPGGLFEVVFLPLVLIFRGFNHVGPNRPDPTDQPVPTQDAGRRGPVTVS